MTYGFLQIANTPDVRAVQQEMGSDRIWDNVNDDTFDRSANRFTAHEAAFIATRDSFYMASASSSGWPYIQHRGGPPGFLRILDEQHLAFADFRGNQQYISTGNLRGNQQTCLFLMDYPRRARLKIYARADILSTQDDPALTELLRPVAYKAVITRIFRLRLEAFDWNCPQHITRRFTAQEIAAGLPPDDGGSAAASDLSARLHTLERENATLRARLFASDIKKANGKANEGEYE